MIRELKTKIFTLMMITLSIVVLGVIVLFTSLNYVNVLNNSTIMMDRIAGMDFERDNGHRPPLDAGIEKFNQDIQIEGVYNLKVRDLEVIDDFNREYDEQIKEYAIKAVSSKRDIGIIDSYIYRVRFNRDFMMVTLVENEDAISRINLIFIYAGIISLISLTIIFILSKKISELLVKPVEETFEKQKEFISDASHELKTPLAVISANAEVVENEVGENKWIGYIQNEVSSMDKLVNELLLLTKIENVDNMKEYEVFNLSEEVDSEVSAFESIAAEHKVELKRDIQKDVMMKGNSEDIRHILSTLTDNAIKHTDEGKGVEVKLFKEKSSIVLEVKNEGDPIPEEHRDKIFERFYRVDKARNRNEKRYGLGLAIAKSTVEKYGGKISVSCKDGVTTFKVIIP